MTAAPITYVDAFLTLRFDEAGFELLPWRGKPVRVEWSEVRYARSVPALERTAEGAWREKRGPGLGGGFDAAHGSFELTVVLADLRPVVARADGWWTRTWINSRLRPMHDARGRPVGNESSLRVTMFRDALGDALTPLLDLLARRAGLESTG